MFMKKKKVKIKKHYNPKTNRVTMTAKFSFLAIPNDAKTGVLRFEK